jgi:hypothetical protein
MSLGMIIRDEKQTEVNNLFHRTFNRKMAWIKVEGGFRGAGSSGICYTIFKDSEGITLKLSDASFPRDYIIDSEPNGLHYNDLLLLWETIESHGICKIFHDREGLKAFFLKWYEKGPDDWCHDLKRQINLYNRCTTCHLGKESLCLLKLEAEKAS